MTKKHFEAAAAYVRGYRHWGPGERELVTEAFVAVFRDFNPRFDVDRFRNACRGEDATDSAGRTVRSGRRIPRVWHVVVNTEGMVLAVYGAALLSMAQEQAASIEHQTGLPVFVRQTGRQPAVGETVQFGVRS